MGQKINPIGFRLALNRNWASRWYANNKNFPVMLLEDLKVREHLKKKLAHAAVSRVVIERPAKNARITIYSARPGVVIGKKGEDIESLKGELQKMLGVPVHVNIEEVRKPETDAQLIADSIAQQLQKRIMFRRAMKRAITNAMRLGAQGIKIAASGRLNGVEIARYEWYREGRVPLHTLRAEIDYGVSTAQTSTGAIGLKVWVFKGEVVQKHDQPAAAVAAALAIAAKPEAAPEAPSGDKPKKPRTARKPGGGTKPGGGAKPGTRSGAKNAATRKA
jgi:small subunit ribosomal protein S3